MKSKTFNLVSNGKANYSEVERFNKLLEKQKKSRFLVIRLNPTGEMIVKKTWQVAVAVAGGCLVSFIVGLLMG